MDPQHRTDVKGVCWWGSQQMFVAPLNGAGDALHLYQWTLKRIYSTPGCD